MIIAQLPTPIIAFGKLITQVGWRLNYPENPLYYQLQTSDGVVMQDGNWIVTDGVISSWGLENSIVSNALIEAAPWDN